MRNLKGHSHEVFHLSVFSPNNTPGPNDSWAKAVSIDSYTRSCSTKKITNFQFYFTAMGEARSPMVVFFAILWI
jgi:hypothetical protein